MSKFLSSKPYSVLSQTESLHSPPGPEWEGKAERRQHTRARWILSVWIATAVFFAALSAWLGAQLYQLRSGGSYARGFSHELGEILCAYGDVASHQEFICPKTVWLRIGPAKT